MPAAASYERTTPGPSCCRHSATDSRIRITCARHLAQWPTGSGPCEQRRMKSPRPGCTDTTSGSTSTISVTPPCSTSRCAALCSRERRHPGPAAACDASDGSARLIAPEPTLEALDQVCDPLARRVSLCLRHPIAHFGLGFREPNPELGGGVVEDLREAVVGRHVAELLIGGTAGTLPGVARCNPRLSARIGGGCLRPCSRSLGLSDLTLEIHQPRLDALTAGFVGRGGTR